MQPMFSEIDFTYKKVGVDVSVLNFDDIPVQKKKIMDRQIVQLGPGAVGGNHRHPRIEWFIAFQPGLELYWVDEAGDIQHRSMDARNGKLLLIEVPAHLPHAVKNITENKSVTVLELADAKQYDVEKVPIIE